MRVIRPGRSNPVSMSQRPPPEGEATPHDLGVAMAIRGAQRDAEVAMTMRDLGMEISDEDYAESVEQEKLVIEDLKAKGYTDLVIRRTLERVWNTLKFDAMKAARKLIGPGSRLDRDEVASEAAVKAYMNIDTFGGDSRLSTWVYSITRSMVFDASKRVTAGGFGKGRSYVPGGLTGRGTTVGEAVEVDEDIYAQAPSVFERHTLTPAERREQEGEIIEEINLGEQRRRKARSSASMQDAIVAEAFAHLSPDHQQILRLRVAKGTYQMPDGSVIESAGLSQSEMAKLLNVSPGTIGSRLGRARKKMLALVGDRVQPPYTGPLAAAWLGEGHVATVDATGHVDTIRRMGGVSMEDEDVVVFQREPVAPSIYQTTGRVGVVRRERRANPYVEGTSFYYETANDLVDLWLMGHITQEQYDACMTALEEEAKG